jgi:hypothetical protein
MYKAVKEYKDVKMFSGIDWDIELRRTVPDYVVFKPETQGSFDSGNQHFLVFNGPDHSLMAIWTQHTNEGAGDHHIAFSRSNDQGLKWTVPKVIAGPTKIDLKNQASWAFPMVSMHGRIYIIYNQSAGYGDYDREIEIKNSEGFKFNWNILNGLMKGIYSDDCGRNWSKSEEIKMPKSPLDNLDPQMPSAWIVWQKPERLSNGKFFTGFTRWVSPVVRTKPHNNSIHAQESVCEFMRFENIDDNPDIPDIKITYTAWGENALRVPYYNNPKMSCAQEPSIVKLPDKRLFVVMRTMSGYIWYRKTNTAAFTLLSVI